MASWDRYSIPAATAVDAPVLVSMVTASAVGLFVIPMLYVGRPGQLELDDGQGQAGMPLEDAGEDLIRLDDYVVAALDPLDPRRTISERRIDAGLL